MTKRPIRYWLKSLNVIDWNCQDCSVKTMHHFFGKEVDQLKLNTYSCWQWVAVLKPTLGGKQARQARAQALDLSPMVLCLAKAPVYVIKNIYLAFERYNSNMKKILKGVKAKRQKILINWCLTFPAKRQLFDENHQIDQNKTKTATFKTQG